MNKLKKEEKARVLTFIQEIPVTPLGLINLLSVRLN